jgi:phytoene dehydrogenase-like protein
VKTSYDAVVVGAGHCGLAAAAYLARAGHTVALVEARNVVGGVAAGAEFHPGYRHVGILHDSAGVPIELDEALGFRGSLRRRSPPPVHVAGTDTVLDAKTLAPWTAWVDEVRPFFRGLLLEPAPDLGSEASLWPLVKPALGFRRLGTQRMMSLLRVGATCVDDWLEEFFSSPAIRAGLGASALIGTWMGPRSPSSSAVLLMRASFEGDELVGGPAALVDALRGAASSAGVEVLLGRTVREIQVESGCAQGVTLSDGTPIVAKTVLSAIGPRRTLLELVHARSLPDGLDIHVERIRTRGITAKVHMALRGPLDIAGGAERFRVGAHPHHWERAFDDAKHRRPLTAPALDVRVPSVSDPSLAPSGHHVVSILVHGAAIDLEGGWGDAQRAALGEAVLSQLAVHDPQVRDKVVAAEVLTPADLRDRFGLEGGHLLHGELGLDQLHALRPTPNLSRHETPIGGLYLGSSGTHPGLGICGWSGILAARAVIEGTRS